MRRQKKAFTLIELLIVVVILGILASIAIVKFANSREKAYVASMKSDLRNMVTASATHPQTAKSCTITVAGGSTVDGAILCQ